MTPPENPRVQSQDEYIAASIRSQIASLQRLLQELEKEAIGEQTVLPKLRTIETHLRSLRQTLSQQVL